MKFITPEIITFIKDNIPANHIDTVESVTTLSEYLYIDDAVCIRFSDHFSPKFVMGPQIIKPFSTCVEDVFVVFYKNNSAPMIMAGGQLGSYLKITITNMVIEHERKQSEAPDTNVLDTIVPGNDKACEQSNASDTIVPGNDKACEQSKASDTNVPDNDKDSWQSYVHDSWNEVRWQDPIKYPDSWQKLACVLGTLPHFRGLLKEYKDYIKMLFMDKRLSVIDIHDICRSTNNPKDLLRAVREHAVGVSVSNLKQVS